jgi:hypothetical protein
MSFVKQQQKNYFLPAHKSIIMQFVKEIGKEEIYFRVKHV